MQPVPVHRSRIRSGLLLPDGDGLSLHVSTAIWWTSLAASYVYDSVSDLGDG
jgi:hypothetical protein